MRRAALVAIAVLAGCLATLDRSPRVRERAAADFASPADRIALAPMDIEPATNWPFSWRASGCEKEDVYAFQSSQLVTASGTARSSRSMRLSTLDARTIASR